MNTTTVQMTTQTTNTTINAALNFVLSRDDWQIDAINIPGVVYGFSGSGRGIRVVNPGDIARRFWDVAVDCGVQRDEAGGSFSDFSSLFFVPDWDAFSAAIAAEFGGETCQIEVSGFEFSVLFRAEAEAALGIVIPKTEIEIWWGRNSQRCRQMAEPLARDTWFSEYDAPPLGIVFTREETTFGSCQWHGRVYSPEVSEVESFRQRLADNERLVSPAARVIREYRGTRLFGALRRAGLEEILRPENADLLDRAMAEAGKPAIARL